MKKPVKVAITGAAGQIAYSLIFRIASGHQQTILWRKSAEALTELETTLRARAGSWGLTTDAIERGLSNTRRTIELLGEGQLLREPVSLRLVERDNALEIELTYKGLPMFVPDLQSTPEVNGETAMTAGLQDVAIGVFPDRSSTTTHGAETTIRLVFYM